MGNMYRVHHDAKFREMQTLLARDNLSDVQRAALSPLLNE